MVTLKSIPIALQREIRPSVRVVLKGAVAADGVLKAREATATTMRLILETQRTSGTTMIPATSSARTVEYHHGRMRSERWLQPIWRITNVISLKIERHALAVQEEIDKS